MIRCVELLTYANQGEKTKGSLTLSFISRASFTKQAPKALTSAYLLLQDPLVKDAESSAHCFLDWFMQTRPPCLSHLCFCLSAAWKESHVPVHGGGSVRFCLTPQTVEVWLPVLGRTLKARHEVPQVVCSAGSAQLVKAATDRRCTDRGNVDLPSFCLQCFSPFFLALACLMPLLPSLDLHLSVLQL